MASQRVPNISATRPEVGGTVESQSQAGDGAEEQRGCGVAGSEMKTTIESARAK